MKKYLVRLSGHSGVTPLEFVREELDSRRLREWSERTLPYYWPVYYTMHIFRDETSGGDGSLVADITSYVAVKHN